MIRRDPSRETRWQSASPFTRGLILYGIPLMLLGAAAYQAAWPVQ